MKRSLLSSLVRKRGIVAKITRLRRLRTEQLEARTLMCDDLLAAMAGLHANRLDYDSGSPGEVSHNRFQPANPYDGDTVQGDPNGDNWVLHLDAQSLAQFAAASAPALLGVFTPSVLSYSTLANGMPILNSLVGAPTSMFLDFDGDTTNTADPTTPYDVDGNPTTFNAAEQATIAEAWRHIATYFAMFDTNVTTIQPPTTTPTAWNAIGNNIVGGYSYVGVVPNSNPRSHNNSGDARTRQSGIAHEFAHNWGLTHQKDYDSFGTLVHEYSSGYDSLHGPIIGVDYAQSVHKWFIGHAGSATALQNDISVIANVIDNYQPVGGDGFRADDYGNTIATATPLTLLNDVQSISGIIERMNDVDVFSFSSNGQQMMVYANPDTPSGLDAKLEIYDALGVLVAAKDGLLNGQQITLVLPVGTYYAAVSSHGNYGDVGTYELSVRTLPIGWTAQDVGDVGFGGFSQFDSATSQFTLGGSGVDIGGTADEMQFAMQTLTGNGTIIAKVASMTNTNSSAKAGIEIRESTDANAKHVAVTATISSGAKFIRRTTVGGASTTTSSTAAAFAPVWVRLTRVGNVFTASTSNDGTTWTQLGTPQTVAMNAKVQIGLVATAQNDTKFNIATFENVLVTGTLGETPTLPNALPAPTGVTVTRSAGSGFLVSWDDQLSETGYRVERSEDGVVFKTVGTNAADATSYSDPNLSGSMRYFYRVRALDASGASIPSTIVSEFNRPTPITNLKLASINTTTIVLDWRDTSGETGYRIERSADGNTYTLLGSVATNVPSYTVSGLAAGSTYFYRVTPTSSFGDGDSVVISGSSRLVQVPGLAFDEVTSSQTRFHWTDITTETGYRIERSTDGTTFTQLVVLPAGTTTYTDTTVLPTTEYYYRVLGTAGTSVSLYNLIFSATPPATPLPSPWSAVDIGTVSGAGSTDLTSGTFRIISSGSTIGGTSDSFRFTSQTLNGDGSIVARIASLEDTAGSARLGVMIRESLAANARNVSISFRPPTTTAQMLSRSSIGGSTTTVNGATLSAPNWLRLTRAGNVFTGATSTNGTTWTDVGQVTIAMASTTYVGLAATANITTQLNTSTATNVTVLANPVVAVTSGNRVYDNTVYVATASITGNNSPLPSLSFVYYSDAGGTSVISAPENAGTYYVRAFSAANAGNSAAQSAISSFQILPFALTVSALGQNKIYDATSVANVTLSDNRFSGDVFTVSATSTFSNKNIGTAKPIAVTGISLSGTDAGNYTFNASTSTNADITVKPLTGNVTAANKVFDDTTAATILSRTLTGVLGSENVSYIGGTATFDTPVVGKAKTVTATGLQLSGADAGNYTVNTVATAAADIKYAAFIFYNGATTTGGAGATGFGASSTPGASFAAAGGNPPATAIDTKVPLLPGNNSSFSNFTNVAFGINGILVDLATPTGTITASDFSFATGETTSQPGFTTLVGAGLTAVNPQVTQYVGGGIGGSTRAKITFNNNSLKNTWLKVTVLANANTALASDEVFYFGNIVGDVNGSVTSSRYTVNAIDTSAVRTNQSTTANSVLVTNLYDFNKSGNVNSLDTSIVRTNQQPSGVVKVINNALMFFASGGEEIGVVKVLESSASNIALSASRSEQTSQSRSYLMANSSVFVATPVVSKPLIAGHSESLSTLKSTNAESSPDLYASLDVFFAALGRGD